MNRTDTFATGIFSDLWRDYYPRKRYIVSTCSNRLHFVIEFDVKKEEERARNRRFNRLLQNRGIPQSVETSTEG